MNTNTEEKKVSAVVKPTAGRSVQVERVVYIPGQTIPAISLSEAQRLDRMGIVEIVKEAAAPAGVSSKLVEAIGELDPSDDKLWTSDGRPQVSALSAITGEDVSAKDRNIAWGEYQDKQEKEGK